MPPSQEVTAILLKASEGEANAVNQLFAVLYDDLRRIAAERMSHEAAGHTLQPTALVHEAYVRLVDQTRCQWQDRSHFLAVASQVMRRILVDHARSRGRAKRGGGWNRVTLDKALVESAEAQDMNLIALDDALNKLHQVHPEKAQVVEMRYFGGLTVAECAQVLGISLRTVARQWDFAQAWLFREISSDPSQA